MLNQLEIMASMVSENVLVVDGLLFDETKLLPMATPLDCYQEKTFRLCVKVMT